MSKEQISFLFIFFSRDIFWFAPDTFWKSACDFEKVHVIKNPKYFPWNLTSCPWQKSQKKCHWKTISGRKNLCKFAKVPVTIFEFCPWQNKKCQWQTSYFFSKILSHQLKLPVFFQGKVHWSFIHSKPWNFAFLLVLFCLPVKVHTSSIQNQNFINWLGPEK